MSPETIQREKVFLDPKLTTTQIREQYNLNSKAAWVAKKKAFMSAIT